MAEEWIDKLVAKINSQDHNIAESDRAAAHRARTVLQDAPTTWKAFSDFAVKYFEEAKEGFAGHVTDTPMAASFEPNRSPQLILSKEAYPSINVTGEPEYAKQSAKVQYYSKNPRLAPAGTNYEAIPFRFEVSHHNKLFIQFDGIEFHDPKEAARHLVTKVLTIPDEPIKI